MKQTILSFLLALLPLVVNADAVEIDGIYYDLIVNRHLAKVTNNPEVRYTGDIVIPESIVYAGETYTVISIGTSAFSMEKITSVVIPNTVTAIEHAAFYGCSELKKITIGSGIQSISNQVFENCYNIESVYISDLAAWCKIEFNTNGGNPLNNSDLYLNDEKVTDLIIPSDITSINDCAFYGCRSLVSVTIPSSVVSVGSLVFRSCQNLTSATFENGVKFISSRIFDSCKNLKSVKIANTVTDIGEGAFYACSSISEVELPNSLRKIDESSFMYCNGLTNITIPNSVASIGKWAFAYCKGLTSIIISNSVTSIGKYTFSGCPELTDVYCYAEKVPNTVLDAFQDSYIEYATLHVPEAAMEQYKATTPWSSFQNFVSIESEYLVTIGLEGFATSCPNVDADFTTVNGVKAYIGSMFNRQTGVLTMTRAYDVPAGTGLLLKGKPGIYRIPTCESFTIISNLLNGVTEETNVNAVEGGYANYVLASGSNGTGFYRVPTEGTTLAAGRAYLTIPAETAASRSALRLAFDDEDEATGISASLTKSEERIVDSAVYDLQGRRVEQPQPGLYIRNGKKVIIK